MHVYVRDARSAPDPLELELQMVVSCHIVSGTEPQSPGRADCVPNFEVASADLFTHSLAQSFPPLDFTVTSVLL